MDWYRNQSTSSVNSTYQVVMQFLSANSCSSFVWYVDYAKIVCQCITPSKYEQTKTIFNDWMIQRKITTIAWKKSMVHRYYVRLMQCLIWIKRPISQDLWLYLAAIIIVRFPASVYVQHWYRTNLKPQMDGWPSGKNFSCTQCFSCSIQSIHQIHLYRKYNESILFNTIADCFVEYNFSIYHRMHLFLHGHDRFEEVTMQHFLLSLVFNKCFEISLTFIEFSYIV